MSLIGGEPIETHGLALVLREAAAAMFVVSAEISLGVGVALVGGEAVEPRGFALVLWEAAAAVLRSKGRDCSGLWRGPGRRRAGRGVQLRVRPWGGRRGLVS